jgi:uracil-DNA glycosylase
LAQEAKKNDKGLVLLLWGNPAAEKVQAIVNSGGKHVVIRTSHPSPLGATKTTSPFIGSRCFSRTNKALVELGYEPIDWNVDTKL